MSARRPNILFLLDDQHRFDAVGCNGAPICRTPAIDGLATRGTRFSRAFTPISLCTPARASLMTGLYPHNHGQLANLGNFNGVFDLQVLRHASWPRLLSQAGYRCAYIGKWHLPKSGDPCWGFETWRTSHDYLRELAGRGVDANYAQEVQRLEWGGDAPFCGRAMLPAEDKEEAWCADQAMEWLDRYAQDAREYAGDGGPGAATVPPFALVVSFHGPHFPYAVPAPYDTLYDPASVTRWPNFDESFAGKPTIQQREQLRWNASHLTWPDWQRVTAHYWGYCTFIDDQFGRLLAKLKALGLDDDTLVVYTTDHGDMLGSHRLFNKGPYMYDETYHVPLVVRWPGHAQAGATCGSFVSTVDLMPTLLAAAGLPLPERIDSRSLVPLLAGAAPEAWPDDVYAEFHGYESCLFTQRMVRTRSWKYVYNPCAEDELYDMASDPGELRNLAGYLGYKHVLRRMKARLVRWLHETHDSIVEDDSWKGTPYDLFLSARER
jgi:arylsulfatase A-like enzyme